MGCSRVARWYIFKPKIPTWVNFGGALEWKRLVHSMVIWSLFVQMVTKTIYVFPCPCSQVAWLTTATACPASGNRLSVDRKSGPFPVSRVRPVTFTSHGERPGNGRTVFASYFVTPWNQCDQSGAKFYRLWKKLISQLSNVRAHFLSNLQ
jgi:hypothetical protein